MASSIPAIRIITGRFTRRSEQSDHLAVYSVLAAEEVLAVTSVITCGWRRDEINFNSEDLPAFGKFISELGRRQLAESYVFVLAGENRGSFH